MVATGVNFWQAMWLGAESPLGDRARLERELDSLGAHGITRVRILAASEGPDGAPERVAPALQPEPGRWDARLLDGLDFTLAALAEREMSAIVCLSNFWHWSGGLGQYLAWSDGRDVPWPIGPSPDWDRFARHACAFYRDARARSWWDAHAARIVERARSSPAVGAWELCNEPRGTGDPDGFRLWIRDAASHVRALDPSRPVAVGTEGSTAEPDRHGLDVALDHASDAVTRTTCHVWPENWGLYDPAHDDDDVFERTVAWARAYVREHAEVARSLGKPLLVEEAGLARDRGSCDPTATTTRRDRFLAALLDEARSLAAEGYPIEAVLAWTWSGEARPGDPWSGDPPHEPPGWYGIYADDETTLDALR